MCVVVLFLLSLFQSALRPKCIPLELWVLLIFALITFSGSTLLSAYDLQFRPLVLILCAFSSYVYFRVLKIDFRVDNAVLTTQRASAVFSDNGYIANGNGNFVVEDVKGVVSHAANQ